MKLLFMTIFLFSLNVYACSLDELVITNEKEIASFAKSMGADKYMSGPAFRLGEMIHSPFTFKDKSGFHQIGTFASSLTSCEVYLLGHGLLQEKTTR